MMHTQKIFRYVALLAAAAFLVCFLIVPVAVVVARGCDLALVVEIFRNRVYTHALVNSTLIACVTTLTAAAIALPLALFYDRYRFPGRDWTSFLMLLPMILPPFVGALGFQQILGRYGIVNTLLRMMHCSPVDFLGGGGTFWSVCVIEALHLYPIFYLNLVTALGNIDPALEDAAANAGASPWRRFFGVTLPLLRPGLLAGGSLVLIWSFTELGTPLMFGYTATTAVQIFNGLTELESNPVPYTLVLVMLAVSLALYLISRRALGGNGAVAAKGNAVRERRELPGIGKYLPTALFSLTAFFSVLPHLALILTAFAGRYYGTLLPESFTAGHFSEALSNPLVLPSIGNSLRYSFAAMLLAMLIGVVAALGISRWRVKGSALLDLLTMAPLAIPGIVVAFGFLSMSVKFDWAATYFNPVENPLFLLATAYAVRRIPYVVRSVVSGLEQTPLELEDAARNFGATPWKTFSRITLPLIFANILVGGLFAFSFSMLEVSDSLLLAQKSQFFPITRALYELSQILGSGNAIASAFGVWSMLFLAATLGAAGALLGRRIGAIFKF